MRNSIEHRKEVVSMYIDQELSSAEILKRTGHSISTTLAWVRDFGYETRTQGETIRLQTKRERERINEMGVPVKRCVVCEQEKPLEEFYLNGSGKYGRTGACIECLRIRAKKRHAENREEMNAQARERRKKDPKKHREFDIKKKFKMSYADYEALLVSQGNKCAACGATASGHHSGEWPIDHDHACCPHSRNGTTCGKCIRGILCRSCNLTLGNAQDNPTKLRQLADYLEAYELRKVA